ncbi:hypothetical protein NMY22_g13495 [Coprinellus aureogranulatus]|nr:hypothetical protein NMY22_g13495 [Coprinellus aureogranulatus]
MTTQSSRVPYPGSRRKLVLAFDVGTTYSGISYSILDPGQVPEIKPVTRFPAHEQISGASKIPTVIYYDKRGNVRAVGAEATRAGIYEMAMQEDWIKSEWFKLRIRPKNKAPDHITANIPPLPLGKTVIQVLANFLRYLQKCAKAYIKYSHVNGRDLWASVESDIHYVISHPNGWEGYQQSQIRNAVVLARLIPDTHAGHSRVSLVTEGEASLHFAIDNGLPPGAFKGGEGVQDRNHHKIRRNSRSSMPLSWICLRQHPRTHVPGEQVILSPDDFTDTYAYEYVGSLKESDFYDDLDHIISCFDKSTKICFNNDQQPHYIKFGGVRDSDPACNIRFGQLKLAGSDVAGFFSPSVKCIVDSVLDMKKHGHKSIKHVVLVGGFSASDWLLAKVEEALAPKGLNVLRPENHVNKAVSDGAISFYLDHLVTRRVSKAAYGNFCRVRYDATDPDHIQRKGLIRTSAANEKMIPGHFANTQVFEEKEFRCDFEIDFATYPSIQRRPGSATSGLRRPLLPSYSSPHLPPTPTHPYAVPRSAEHPQWRRHANVNPLPQFDSIGCAFHADPRHAHQTRSRRCRRTIGIFSLNREILKVVVSVNGNLEVSTSPADPSFTRHEWDGAHRQHIESEEIQKRILEGFSSVWRGYRVSSKCEPIAPSALASPIHPNHPSLQHIPPYSQRPQTLTLWVARNLNTPTPNAGIHEVQI